MIFCKTSKSLTVEPSLQPQALADLELTTQVRLVLNWQTFSCLCLWDPGLKRHATMPSLRYTFFTVAKLIETFLGNLLKIKAFNNLVFQLKSLFHTCAKLSQFNEETDFQIWHWSWRDKLWYKLSESYERHNRCSVNNCCAESKRFPYVYLALWGQAPSASSHPFVPSLSVMGHFFFFKDLFSFSFSPLYFSGFQSLTQPSSLYSCFTLEKKKVPTSKMSQD